MEENILWNQFKSSGKIDDYLTYKGFKTKEEIEKDMKIEIGSLDIQDKEEE